MSDQKLNPFYATLFGAEGGVTPPAKKRGKGGARAGSNTSGDPNRQRLVMAAECEQVAACLRQHPGMTSAELQDATGLCRRRLQLRLIDLRNQGRIFFVRKRRAGLQGTTCRWYLTTMGEPK